MPIIWRGWGPVVIVFIILGLGTGAALAQTGKGQLFNIFAGLGLMIWGAACFGAGYYLNVVAARKKVAEHVEALRTDLHQRVAQGTFQVAPGAAAPATPEEADAQVESLVQVEQERAVKAYRNRHSLYYLPIQWWGVLEAVGGVVTLGMALAG